MFSPEPEVHNQMSGVEDSTLPEETEKQQQQQQQQSNTEIRITVKEEEEEHVNSKQNWCHVLSNLEMCVFLSLYFCLSCCYERMKYLSNINF